MEKRLDKKFAKRESDISVLDTTKDVLEERVGWMDSKDGRSYGQEGRIWALEMPFRRQKALMRQLAEPPAFMPMLADDDDAAAYRYFKWTIPREALEQATDEALERGLVTSIEIGTMPNIRSLTSIKMTLDNGIEKFESPRFGDGKEFKTGAVN